MMAGAERAVGSQRIAVCGAGLIGTSLALGLSRVPGCTVQMTDQDPAVRRQASAHLLAAGVPTSLVVVAESWSEAARGADVLIAAVPPTAVAGVLVEGSAVAARDAVLTDVAGVKASVLAAVHAALRVVDGDAIARYVGGHPMAGSERSGPTAADGDLFLGATWVLTPTEETDDAALARLGRMVGDLGGRVLVLDPDRHDTIVGLVSHLPQVVASVLTDVAAKAVGPDRDAVLAVAGPGFRDSTRIAASDPDLWLNILAENRAAVTRALLTFQEGLAHVVTALTDGDEDVLRGLLARASEARRRLLPKALDAAVADLLVPLRDRPGELARIASALGTAGINIEDLTMRHATGADRGALLLRVRSAESTRAVEVLASAGFAALSEERPSTPVSPTVGP